MSATGSEPRVPQKRTRFIGAAPGVVGRRAGGDSAASASRTVGNTSNTCLKRAMSKISATTGCSAATAIRALRARSCLRRDHQTRRPMLLT